MVAKTLSLPNIRKLFIPDDGFIIADADLAGADARVVAWEANDLALMQAFREGLSVHAENAKEMFGPDAGPDGRREPIYSECKVAVHATNYGASYKTIAANLGWTRHKAEQFQKRWFAAHPAIPEWHDRTYGEIQKTRMVRNKFGYRRVYFDRTDGLLPEALAWVPQSTVALVCTKGANALRKAFSKANVQILLQVHDSLVFQYPIEFHQQRHLLLSPLQIPIPYDDPLTIPWSLKTSDRSWGHAEPTEWKD